MAQVTTVNNYKFPTLSIKADQHRDALRVQCACGNAVGINSFANIRELQTFLRGCEDKGWDISTVNGVVSAHCGDCKGVN